MSPTFFKTALIASAFTFSPLAANAAENIEEWAVKARKEIIQNQYYPKGAVNQGIEGSVKVRFDVSQRGLVKGVQIVETSGSDILDAQALKVAAKLDKLPTLPTGMAEHTFIVPITFQIDKEEDRAVSERNDTQSASQLA